MTIEEKLNAIINKYQRPDSLCHNEVKGWTYSELDGEGLTDFESFCHKDEYFIGGDYMKYFLILLISIFSISCASSEELKFRVGDKVNINQVVSKRIIEKHRFYRCEDEGKVINFWKYPSLFGEELFYTIEFSCKFDKVIVVETELRVKIESAE